MTDETVGIALLLDEVLPPRSDGGDWQRVVRDAAGSSKRRALFLPPTLRWRLALAVVGGVVAIVAPLSALAVANDWWFLGAASAPAPAGQIVIVDSGSWNNVPWTLSAYRSQTGGLCVAFTPNAPDGRPTEPTGGHTSAMSCTSDLPGLANAAGTGTAPHSIGFVGSSSQDASSSAFPDFVAGPAAQNVDQVRVTLASGKQVLADTVAAPQTLGLPVRFYVVPLPAGDPARTLTALNSSGDSLEQLTIPQAPTVPAGTGSTSPNSTGGVEWGG